MLRRINLKHPIRCVNNELVLLECVAGTIESIIRYLYKVFFHDCFLPMHKVETCRKLSQLIHMCLQHTLEVPSPLSTPLTRCLQLIFL